MLEVIGENPDAGELFVVAGLGRSANWYRNTKAGHAVEVAVARDRFTPANRELGLHEAVAVLADYERRNRLIAPVIHGVLSRLVGWRYDGTLRAQPAIARETVETTTARTKIAKNAVAA